MKTEPPSNPQQLLPCPFCGASAVVVSELWPDCTVACGECDAMVDHEDEAEAIKKWNRRTKGGEQ